MVCNDSELKFSEKEVRVVFALSKQSVRQDCTDQGILKLQRLLFVEFLEFLARLAVLRFSGTELEDYSLKEKLEFVLDDLFTVIDETRTLVEQTDEAYQSESDDDY